MRLRVSATGFRVSLECPSNEQGCIVRFDARIQLGAILHCKNFASELRVRTKTQEWLVFNSNIFRWLLGKSFSRFVCFTQSTLSFEIVHILAILVTKKYENSSLVISRSSCFAYNHKHKCPSANLQNNFSHSCKYCHKMNLFGHFNPQSYTFYTHFYI